MIGGRLRQVKVALFKNATLATLMSDFNDWTAGTGTGGTSASGLPTVREQAVLDVWLTATNGTAAEYQLLVAYTE